MKYMKIKKDMPEFRLKKGDVVGVKKQDADCDILGERYNIVKDGKLMSYWLPKSDFE